LAREIAHQHAEIDVECDKHGDEDELRIEPAAGDPVSEPEPEAEDDRKYGARRHDAAIELSLHRLETLDADAIVRRREGVIDKQARQIEKTGEPRHHRDDVQALYDQHGGAQSTSAAAAASARAQRNTRRRRTLRAPRCARR